MSSRIVLYNSQLTTTAEGETVFAVHDGTASKVPVNIKAGIFHGVNVVTKDGKEKNYEAMSGRVNAREGSSIYISPNPNGTSVLIRYTDASPPFPTHSIQWTLKGAEAQFQPLAALDVSDNAWDDAQLTTKDDLDRIGGVDEWLRAAEGLTGEGGSHYSDEWSFYMFWINNIRYADRTHQANEITIGDSNTTLNSRPTRTVVESGPTLLNSTTTKLPDVDKQQTIENDTDEDQTYDVNITETEGTQSALSVTRQSSITVGANVTIGDFGVNASGSVTQDESKSLTKDTTTTTETTHTTLVKAKKRLTVTTTISASSTVSIYQTKVKIRGRLNQPSLNVPPAGGSFSDIGQWVSIDSLPNGIGAATEGLAEFQLSTVTTSTLIRLKETDLPKTAEPKPKKLPAFPAAFRNLQ